MQQGTYPDECNKLLHNKDIDKGYRRKHIPVSRGLILSVIKHYIYCKREKTTPVPPPKDNVATERHCERKTIFEDRGRLMTINYY